VPYCTHCGNQVGTADRFCAGCGTPQAAPGGGGVGGGSSKTKGIFDSLTPHKASLLCYIPVVGWIPSIIVLASSRFQNDRTVRFHAFQGLYLFVAWLLADWVIGPLFSGMRMHIGGLLKAAILCAWVFMIVKTSQNDNYHLPIVGEIAERSASEQR